MSTTVPKPLFDPFLVTTGTTTPYTVPAGTKTIIKHLTGFNNGTAPVNLRVYLVESGGTAGDSNTIFNQPIAAKQSAIIFGAINATLETGATIQVVADTASSISLHGGGNEIVG